MKDSEKMVENLLYLAELDFLIKDKVGKVSYSILRIQADKIEKDARGVVGSFDENVADEAFYLLSNKKAEVEAEIEKGSTAELRERELILNTAQDYISDYYLCLNGYDCME